MDQHAKRLMNALVSGDQAQACELLAAHDHLRDVALPDLSGNGREYLPLHVAGFTGQEDVARKLVQLGADPSVVESTHKGWTPLHFAGQHRRAGIASILLKAGADVNAQDAEGRTPLHWSAINDTPEVARVLVASGADLALADHVGKTARQYAEENEHLEVVQALSQR